MLSLFMQALCQQFQSLHNHIRVSLFQKILGAVGGLLGWFFRTFTMAIWIKLLSSSIGKRSKRQIDLGNALRPNHKSIRRKTCCARDDVRQEIFDYTDMLANTPWMGCCHL